MIPLKLILHNFMSYQNPPPLDFSSFDLACISGVNGSGKSTLLEAIAFVLWGKARSSPDSLVHHHQQGMWVDFQFLQDGNTYRVIRKRSKKGKGTSDFEFLAFNKKLKTWETQAGATIKETEEKLQKILKLPYDIFINSAYLRQGHADEFSSRRPAERKEILGQILGLEIYDKAQKKVKERIKTKEAEIEALQGAIYEIEEELKQKDAFEKEYKQAAENLKQKQKIVTEEQEKLNKLAKEKSKYDLKTLKLENANTQLMRIENEGKNLKAELESINNELREIESLLTKKPEIENGYKKLQQARKNSDEYGEKLAKLTKLEGKMGEIKAKETEINQRISRLMKIKKCPTCLRILTKKEADKIINDLKQDYQQNIKPEKNEIEENVRKLDYDESRHRKIKTEIAALNFFEEKKRRLAIALSQKEEKKKSITKLYNDLKRKRADYTKIVKEQKQIEADIKNLMPILDKWQEQENKVERLREGLLEIREVYGAFKQRLLALEEKEKIYQEKKEKLLVLAKGIGVFKMLEQIFSKTGIQTMILETVLPEIEEEANQILEKITQGKMQLKFITTREKKTGEGEIETLDIQIEDSFGKRDYQLYSGGEAFRIDLAIRVALSKVLSKRAGTKLQFLAIDEGFGSLDQTGKDEVVEAINGLKPDFEKILVVTHIQELKNLFSTRIEVIKDEGGSVFQVVSV